MSAKTLLGQNNTCGSTKPACASDNEDEKHKKKTAASMFKLPPEVTLLLRQLKIIIMAMEDPTIIQDVQELHKNMKNVPEQLQKLSEDIATKNQEGRIRECCRLAYAAVMEKMKSDNPAPLDVSSTLNAAMRCLMGPLGAQDMKRAAVLALEYIITEGSVTAAKVVSARIYAALAVIRAFKEDSQVPIANAIKNLHLLLVAPKDKDKDKGKEKEKGKWKRKDKGHKKRLRLEESSSDENEETDVEEEEEERPHKKPKKH